MSDTDAPEKKTVIEVDEATADALGALAGMFVSGSSQVTPQNVEKLIEMANATVHMRPPADIVGQVVFASSGARYQLSDERIWSEYDVIEKTESDVPGHPGRVLLVGNAVIQITPAGESQLTIFRNADLARASFFLLAEAAADAIKAAQSVEPVDGDGSDDSEPSEPVEEARTIVGYDPENGPVYKD